MGRDPGSCTAFRKCAYRPYLQSWSYSAFSGVCSAGFMVLTRRAKYSRWQTHTTAMQTLPMGAFFMQRKPMAITAVTIAMILHFVPAVMAFF